jgi:polyhydroxyalkanoate synthesis regulator phasin
MIQYNDFIDDLINYENGELTPEQTKEFFQTYQDTLISLQGSYGRNITRMVKTGEITPTPRICSLFKIRTK